MAWAAARMSGVEGDLVAAETDRGGADRPQGADDGLDRGAGGVLEVAGDRGRGGHDGQVGLDRLPLVVDDRPCAEVGLAMRNDFSIYQRS